MKRDLNLIRAILLDLEEHCSGDIAYQPTKATVPYAYSGTDGEFEEHCRLIADRGLAKELRPMDSGTSFLSLTWDGHDFLDNARDPKIWALAKKAAGTLSFGVFFKILGEAAVKYALERIEE